MRFYALLAAALLLFSASPAFAAGEVMVFDLQKVASESDALKVAKEALDQKFGKDKADLENERKGIEQEIAKFKDKKPTDAERKAIADKERAYNEKAQAFLRLLQADELRVRTDLDTVIRTALQEIGKKKGYAMILDIAAVPWTDPKNDITNDVLTETNAQWKKIAGK